MNIITKHKWIGCKFIIYSVNESWRILIFNWYLYRINSANFWFNLVTWCHKSVNTIFRSRFPHTTFGKYRKKTWSFSWNISFIRARVRKRDRRRGLLSPLHVFDQSTNIAYIFRCILAVETITPWRKQNNGNDVTMHLKIE